MEFGSGSALLGGTDPIQQALQARSMGGGTAPFPQSPASGGQMGSPQQMPQSQGSVQPAPQMGGTPAPQSMMGQMGGGAPQQSSEAVMIIEALGKRLENDSKMKKIQQERGY